MKRRPIQDALGLEELLALPVVPAADHDGPVAEGQGPGVESVPVLDSERAYRICKAIVDHPLRPSSEYPPLAGISPRTVQPIRARLVEAGLVREHTVESGGRGRPPVLLEALPAAIEAIRNYEQRRAQGR